MHAHPGDAAIRESLRPAIARMATGDYAAAMGALAEVAQVAFEGSPSLLQELAAAIVDAAARQADPVAAMGLRHLAATMAGTPPAPPLPVIPPPPVRGVAGMVPGHRYRVGRTFTDHVGQVVAAGRRMTFRTCEFFPHDDGHILRFDEGEVRLTGLVDDQADVLLNRDGAYFVPDDTA